MTEQLYTIISYHKDGYTEKAVNISDLERFKDAADRDGYRIEYIIKQEGKIDEE
jgi:hypothetical protein